MSRMNMEKMKICFLIPILFLVACGHKPGECYKSKPSVKNEDVVYDTYSKIESIIEDANHEIYINYTYVDISNKEIGIKQRPTEFDGHEISFDYIYNSKIDCADFEKAYESVSREIEQKNLLKQIEDLSIRIEYLEENVNSLYKTNKK